MRKVLETTIRRICTKYELDEFLAKLDRDIQSIRMKGLRIAFLGPVKSGKSTMINALLGDAEILPAQETPTTGCITEILNGPELRYRVYDGTTDEGEEVSRDKAHKHILGKLSAEKVEVRTASLGMLDDGVFIVDTPGIRSTVKSHDLITQEYLPEVDQAFFVMSAEHGAPQASALEFIRDDISDLDLSKLFFVVTKSDLFDSKEQDRILDRFRKDLSKVVVNPRVFIASGLLALESMETPKEDKGNLNTIASLISEEMQSRKKHVINDKVHKLLRYTGEQLTEVLISMKDESGTDTASLESESSDLKKEIANLEALMSKLERNFRDLRKRGFETADATAKELSGILVAQYQAEGSLSTPELEKTFSDFQQAIKSSVSNGLKEIDGLESLAMHSGFNDVLGEVSNLDEMISVLDKVATFAVVAWLAPGETAFHVELDEGLAGGGAAFLDELLGKTSEDQGKQENKSKKENDGNDSDDDGKPKPSPLKQILRQAAKLNLIHQASEKLIKPLVFKKASYTKFRRKFHRYVSDYFMAVEKLLSTALERDVVQPIRIKEEALHNILKARKSEVDDYQQLVSDLSDDIRSLRRDLD